MCRPEGAIGAIAFSEPHAGSDFAAIRASAPIYNGNWQFSTSDQPYIWKTQKLVLMPRVGMALRVDDRTAFTSAAAELSDGDTTRAKMAADARTLYEQYFDWQIIASRVTTALDDARSRR